MMCIPSIGGILCILMEFMKVKNTPAYLWSYKSSILDDYKIPKSLKFTDTQLEFLRIVLSSKECITSKDRIFAKLLGLGWVIENQSNEGFYYLLSDSAKIELDKICPTNKRKNNRCLKCDGQGRIKEYGYIAGGVCFLCNGKGYKYRKYYNE